MGHHLPLEAGIGQPVADLDFHGQKGTFSADGAWLGAGLGGLSPHWITCPRQQRGRDPEVERLWRSVDPPACSGKGEGPGSGRRNAFHRVVSRAAPALRISRGPYAVVTSPAMATLPSETVGMRAEALPQRRRRNSLLATAGEPSAAGSVGPRRPGNAEQSRHAHAPSNLTAVKVLVVDDDAPTLDYFSFALETCGAVVTIAMSAREALRIVTQVSPDVILTDIAMPGEDGYWLLSEIRHHADGGVSGLPVVAATAYGRDHSRARVLAAGFLDHLPKPIDPDVLCQAIAAAVGR